MMKALLILMATPILEDALIDVLLAQAEIKGFTSSKANGYGLNASALAMVEQVTGKQNRLQFLVEADVEILQRLISKLKLQFANADLYYLLLPVIESGTTLPE